MAKFKYKNVTDNELTIPNVGVVKAGEFITTDEPIENPNLELEVKEEKTK